MRDNESNSKLISVTKYALLVHQGGAYLPRENTFEGPKQPAMLSMESCALLTEPFVPVHHVG